MVQLNSPRGTRTWTNFQIWQSAEALPAESIWKFSRCRAIIGKKVRVEEIQRSVFKTSMQTRHYVETLPVTTTFSCYISMSAVVWHLRVASHRILVCIIHLMFVFIRLMRQTRAKPRNSNENIKHTASKLESNKTSPKCTRFWRAGYDSWEILSIYLLKRWEVI